MEGTAKVDFCNVGIKASTWHLLLGYSSIIELSLQSKTFIMISQFYHNSNNETLIEGGVTNLEETPKQKPCNGEVCYSLKVFRLCLPFDSGASYDKAFKVLQNFLSIADHSPIFIDFPVILMMEYKHNLLFFRFTIDYKVYT